MKLKYTISVLLVLAVAAGCSRTDIQDGPRRGEQVSLRAALAAIGTRTWLDSEAGGEVLPVYWSDGDRINVNGQNSAPLEIEGEEKVSDAEFLLRSVLPPYNVIYPAAIVSAATYDAEGKIPVTIPSVQEYVSGGFGNGAAILYGYGADEQEAVSLRNLCSAVRVCLKDAESTVIGRAILTSASSPVAGEFTLKPSAGELAAVDGVYSVSLALGEEGVALTEEGTWFYFTLPAGEYTGEIVFEFARFPDRRKMFCTWSVPGTLEPGVLYSFSDVQYVPGAKSIENPEDWNEFALDVNSGADIEEKWIHNGAIELGCDIESDDLDKVTGKFTGTFDGCGHTIRRNAGTGALFRNVRGTVKNLRLEGEINTTYIYCASVADTLYAEGRIENCVNDVAVTLDAASYGIAGGIAAVMTGGVISGCSNTAPVKVSVDCSSQTQYNLQAGGIVGQVYTAVSGAPCSDALIEHCSNSGKITADPIYDRDDDSYGIQYAGIGGIAGWLRGTAHSFTIDDCINTGDIFWSAEHITSTKGMKYFSICVGGIVGIAAHMSSGYLAQNGGQDITISSCVNSGTVYNCGANAASGTNSVRKAFTGGIAGAMSGAEGKYASLSGCTNTGTLLTYDLTGEGTFANPYNNQVAGGLMGYTGYVSVDGCTLNCTIGNGRRASFSVGGVTGMAMRPFTISNSTIWCTAYFTRIFGSNHLNSATYAVVPKTYGNDSLNPQPAIATSYITDTSGGLKLYYYNTSTSSVNDDSERCASASTILNGDGGSGSVRGYGYNTTATINQEVITSGLSNLKEAPVL